MKTPVIEALITDGDAPAKIIYRGMQKIRHTVATSLVTPLLSKIKYTITINNTICDRKSPTNARDRIVDIALQLQMSFVVYHQILMHS